MLDKIRDFFKRDEDFSERLKDSKNPFLGTLSLIWVIRNWQIVYAILFDDRAFEVRLAFIKTRLSAITFWEIIGQFIINVLLTLLAIVVIYLFVYLTRFITNKFENKLLPWIYEKSAPDRIVLKSDYDELNKDFKNLEVKLEKEREKRIATEAEIERIETKERDKALAELSTTKADEIDDEYLEYFEPIEKKIIEKYGEQNVLKILTMISNRDTIPFDTTGYEIADDLQKMDYLTYYEKGINGKIYAFKDDGKEFWKKLYK